MSTGAPIQRVNPMPRSLNSLASCLVRPLQLPCHMRILGILAAVFVAGCMGDVPTGGNAAPDAAPIAIDAPPPPPPIDAPDPAALIKEWSGCMTLANFKTAKMAVTWGSLSTTNGQQCANCHSTGGQGFIASLNETVYFQMVTQQSAYMLKYFTVDSGKVIVNTQSLKNAAITLTDHPRFDPTNNPGMPALQKFYDLTVAVKAAGPCPAPVLVN
ncbi:MAG: hypothetical protein JWO36_5059 [Myxococcales bacterium]|nr:hypothetical protein [Myxococcales bacterium]